MATLTAVVLCLMIQFGHAPNVTKLLSLWQAEADTVVLEEAPSAEEVPVPPNAHGYSLYYADAGHALILYDRSLIVVSPGSALPDGSRVSRLSPNRLVTTTGQALQAR